ESSRCPTVNSLESRPGMWGNKRERLRYWQEQRGLRRGGVGVGRRRRGVSDTNDWTEEAPFNMMKTYAGEVGEYAGDVGLYAGDLLCVVAYAGLVGLYAGDVGEYDGDVGE
ncbi:hypothetical protein FOZ62_001594, partial [Perkinsus olseni]